MWNKENGSFQSSKFGDNEMFWWQHHANINPLSLELLSLNLPLPFECDLQIS